MMMILTMILLQITTPTCLNSTISNTIDPATLMKLENLSPCLGGGNGQGYLGFAIWLAVFIIFSLAFSLRIKVVHALLAGSYVALLTALILVTIGILNTAVVMLSIGLALLATLLSVFDHVLHPFD